MPNHVDPDQTPPLRGSLIWARTICMNIDFTSVGLKVKSD